ncbi:50S ribosomal protein L16 3-hydroxylase [Vibrio stylophorae]|uniref:50S ribosomal protein L16 3-hydroxylase n=1 Tax=Vibrio stylophorae TaxID=659351 RepID=A0ABN8DRS6_9VIBR|nr:cupin domain-containing protein [Vibrio stylophorae]CAH0533357.1 50S ribosomal protein L16 3-hydroxylase [Vibrio stylophorae]
MYSLNFDLNQFVAEFWHQKPTVIRQGFANFVDPISADEIAGLAMESEIDSRMVKNANNQWQAFHGPFEDFSALSDTHSQLIVQAANHWHHGLQALAKPFEKLPNWLFDDVMICLSMPEGGVGPHIDQYDVFIIQGSGKRHWRVGDLGDYQDANHETGLRQITGFDAIIDTVLEPGDILYIPPGFPHEGKSLTQAQSYSVGYRSPKAQELLSGFADHILANDLGDKHLHSTGFATRDQHGMISHSDRQELDALLMSLLNNQSMRDQWLGEQLSQARHELDIIPADPLWQAEELQQSLLQGAVFERVAGLKALYHQDAPQTLFIHGDSYRLPEGCETVAALLCDNHYFSGAQLAGLCQNSDLIALLTELCNLGYWYLPESE